MPENIIDEPRAYALVNSLPQPAFTSNISRHAVEMLEKGRAPKLDVSRSEIVKVIPSINDKVHSLFPDVSMDTIREFSGFYFGEFNLDDDIALHDSGLSVEQKKLSAQLQLTRAHSVLFASLNEEVDGEYCRKVMNSVAAHEAVARSETGKKERALVFNSGVASFVGISRYLHESGFEVYIPDYSGDAKEVEEWDVLKGVDGCAIRVRDGKDPLVLLYDAKGQANYLANDRGGRVGQRNMPDFNVWKQSKKKISEFPKSLRDLMSLYDPSEEFRSVYAAKIIIPTSPQYISYFESAYRQKGSRGPREVLGQYARISDLTQQDLDRALNYIMIEDKIVNTIK